MRAVSDQQEQWSRSRSTGTAIDWLEPSSLAMTRWAATDVNNLRTVLSYGRALGLQPWRRPEGLRLFQKVAMSFKKFPRGFRKIAIGFNLFPKISKILAMKLCRFNDLRLEASAERCKNSS
jgi:hypothetical protein